jgi:putative chitinase
LIYIANSKGTAWFEMTSDGKIDIYAKDSISMHTENDFNFRADRDINIEAGRNLNIRAIQNMETNVTGHYFLIVDDNAKILIRNDLDETVGQSSSLTVGQDLNISVVKDTLITSSGEMNLAAEAAMKQSTGGSFHVGAAGNYYETAATIHMNGPSALAAAAASPAVMPPYLSLFSNPNRSDSAGWANGQFYKAESITSIMQRVPSHEPWDQHENINPTKFSAAATDVTLQDTPGSARANSGIAPTSGTATPANTPDVIPGVCDAKYATMIGKPSAQEGIAALKAAATELGLTSPYAVASLLAISGGETKWLLVKEIFTYTTVARLLQVFPSSFKGNAELAAKYTNSPDTLAEFVYGPTGATGNKSKVLGNTQPGDGSRFIGRPYFGLTGRAAYTYYSKLMYDHKFIDSPTGLVDNPDILMTAQTAARVSVLFLLDRVKVPQTDAGYFEAAVKKVGFCVPDIYATKKGLYNCFLGQLQGGK